MKNQIFGDFSLHNNTYNSHAADYRAFVTVKEKLLKEDLDAAIAMTEEILFHTKYDVVESMKKNVKSAKIKGENELLNQSHYFAIFYGGSNLFPALRIEDITSGIRYYRFLCEIDAQLEQDAAPVIAKLKKKRQIFSLHSGIWRLLWAVRRVKGRLYRQKSTPSVRNYLRRNKSILYTILI